MTISKADVEAKAREITQVVSETKENAQNTALVAGAGIALVVGLAYLLGRRKGKSGRAVVEVYKV
ncbi:MAG: LPXTG cell wall anchor domain-containing protein [Acidimicrobiia bacterium]